MITGRGGSKLAAGQRGAFYNTLEEFRQYWDRIDIIAPGIKDQEPRSNFVSPSWRGPAGTKKIFENVHVHPSPWPLIFQPFWILKEGQKIFQEQKFNLITVHDYPPFYNGLGTRWLSQKIGLPYIAEIMHLPGYPQAGNLKEKMYGWCFKSWANRILIRPARAVRVINQEMERLLINLGVPTEKIKLWPAFYLDLDIFKPQNLPKKYDLIFIGRLEPNKGADLFLQAVEQSGLSAALVGTGSQEKKIKLKIRNGKLKINAYGWAKDSTEIASLLNQSRLLVVPSFNEGGPRVVLEALACGVPVLATPVGIVPEMVGQTGAGRLIDWQAEDIVQKAKELLTNPNLYHLAQTAGLEIRQKFEKKEVIKKYAEGLKSII